MAYENNDKDGGIFFSPFGVRIKRIYNNYEEFLLDQQEDINKTIEAGDIPTEEVIDTIKDMLSELGWDPGNSKYRKPRDCSFGGSDVINCYPQFHEDDDIGYPLYQIGSTDDYKGLGRVYAHNIYENQQILWLSFGVPKYCGLINFYKDSLDSDLADLMHNGEVSTLKKVMKVLGYAVGVVLMLPILPLVALAWIFKAVSYPVGRYYDIRSTMPLYYKMVNTITTHLAVNMGINQIEPGSEKVFGKALLEQIKKDEAVLKKQKYESSSLKPNPDKSPDGPPIKTIAELRQEKIDAIRAKSERVNEMPESTGIASKFFADRETDVLKFMQKRIFWEGTMMKNDVLSIDDFVDKLVEEGVDESMGVIKRFGTSIRNNLFRSIEFVGFKVEKSTDNSESLSNSTGESSVAQKMNSNVANFRSKKFDLAYGNVADNIVFDAIEGIISAIKTSISSAAKIAGFGDVEDAMKQFTGSGYLDFPEMYQSSSFSKSFSFKVSLNALYGSPLSIYYHVYMPLAFILAASFPRATGPNSYTAPFICRAFCKGMFAIPLGMIDNVSITRGSSEYGWSKSRLPMSIDVNFSIKDLSPIMFIAPDVNLKPKVLGANTSFQEYMLTLASVGVDDRLSLLRKVRLRAKITIDLWRKTFSPENLGFKLGNVELLQMVAALIPISDLPDANEYRRYYSDR